jgi:hypothetical protein
MPYLWAGYMRGAFDAVPELVEGMDSQEFLGVFLALIGDRVLADGGDVWTFFANTPKGEIPVGVVIASASRENHLEPHVFWFPEASARNKLECALKWIVETKEKHKLDMWVAEADWKFYDHLCKYGAIRTVGKRRKFFMDGRDAYLFQEVS